MNTCGGCTLCCKILGVDELQKPEHRWCAHCRKGAGCGIYDDRPESCREFECGWLSSALEQRYRPDRLHMIIAGKVEPMNAHVVSVDPSYPDAWRRADGQSLLRLLTTEDRYPNVIIRIGERREFIGPDRDRIAAIIREAEEAASKRDC